MTSLGTHLIAILSTLSKEEIYSSINDEKKKTDKEMLVL